MNDERNTRKTAYDRLVLTVSRNSHYNKRPYQATDPPSLPQIQIMKNNTLHRNGIFAPTVFLILLSVSHVAFAQSTTQFVANRLNNSQPIIDQAMFAAVGVEADGANINGPSLLRIPDWILPADRADPSAVYYLYFAHHDGSYIRMAWATEIEGPWTFYQIGSDVPLGDRGVLDNGFADIDLGMGVVIAENHLASPDVLVDDQNQQIIMYFHSGSPTVFNNNPINSQNSWVSTSDNGLEFLDNIRPVRLGPSYFKVFSHGGELYALDNSGRPKRAPDPDNPWEPPADYYSGTTISSLWESNENNTLQDAIFDALGVPRSVLRVRHPAVRVVGDELQVFYTQRGDTPERVQLSTIDLTADFDDWVFSYPGQEILQATPGWEGGQFPPDRSELGAAPENVNQLRDPDIFEDIDGSLYLFYAGGGEDAIGVAELISNLQVSADLRDEGGVLARPDLIGTFAVTFNTDVNVSANDLVIRNESLGQTLTESSGLLFDYDATTFTATWNFSNVTLAPAFYSVELPDTIVSAVGSLIMDGDADGIPGGAYVRTIHVALPGDTNLDGQVDVLGDAFTAIANLGTTSDAVWAQGDFNGDGIVEVLADAFLLISQLGQSVLP